MMIFVIKAIVAGSIIAFASWLAAKKPELAGFIIALPIASLLALAFTHFEHKDASTSIIFAKSILVGVPISWLFFAPFFLADKLGNNFWICYIIGLVLLAVGYLLHQYITKII